MQPISASRREFLKAAGVSGMTVKRDQAPCLSWVIGHQVEPARTAMQGRFPESAKSLKSGARDGARTRDLRRDRPAL
jgi:hypothetical protein